MAIIDHGLADTASRQLVSSEEVSDLLLDLRSALVAAQIDALRHTTAVGPGGES